MLAAKGYVKKLLVVGQPDLSWIVLGCLCHRVFEKNGLNPFPAGIVQFAIKVRSGRRLATKCNRLRRWSAPVQKPKLGRCRISPRTFSAIPSKLRVPLTCLLDFSQLAMYRHETKL